MSILQFAGGEQIANHCFSLDKKILKPPIKRSL